MAGIDKIIQDVEQLPALPSSVAKVTAMLSDGVADMDGIQQVIRHDEALCTAVLRMANSAMYGIPGRTFELRDSLVRLGGKTLMKLVLEQKLSHIYDGAGSAYGLRRGALWRGALGGALAAELVATSHGFEQSELAFLCGLVRDIGKLAMDSHFGSAYADIMDHHDDPDRNYLECERDAFGADHAEVGAALAELWRLPERVVDAIRYHHQPPAEEALHDDLFDLVHAGDVICLWAGLAIGHDGLQYSLAPHVRGRFIVDRKAAECEVAETWMRLTSLEEALGDAPVQGDAA